MKLWIDGIEQVDAPDVLYPAEWARKLHHKMPAARILIQWFSIPGKQYGEGVYAIDPTHALVGTRWRSKDHRDVAAAHNQDRRVVYVENFRGTKRAALRAEGRNHTALVKVVNNRVDRHERIV